VRIKTAAALAVRIALLFLFAVPPALAVEPDEVLDDPALEARARELSRDLRCMVCQNQSIDDSDAPLAKDLRILVRERLVAGDSDTEVIDYLVVRFGEFVLLKPRVGPATYILWGAPAIILVIGLAVLFAALRRRRTAATDAARLTPDEEREIAHLLAARPDRE
jgi:cytochrome c-type biogenesis protein CcmH